MKKLLINEIGEPRKLILKVLFLLGAGIFRRKI